MGLCIYAKCDPIVLKQLLFFFKLQKSPNGSRLCPQTPLNNTFELQYTSLLKMSPNLDIFAF